MLKYTSTAELQLLISGIEVEADRTLVEVIYSVVSVFIIIDSIHSDELISHFFLIFSRLFSLY